MSSNNNNSNDDDNDNNIVDANSNADDEFSTTSNNTTTTDSSTTSDSSIYIPTYENELITLSVPPPPPTTTTTPTLDNDDNDDNGMPTKTNNITTQQPHHHSFEVLTVVPPPLEYMMTLHDEDREISGRQVWCGSFLLCAVLLWKEEETSIIPMTMTSSDSNGCSNSSGGTTSSMAGGSLIRGKRVLELGSGTGILGMLASKLNPTCVAITDGDDQAVNLLQKNLSNPTNDIDEQLTKACALSWGTLTTMEESGDAAATTTTDDNDDTKRGQGFHAWCRTSWPDIYPTAVGTAMATTTIATEVVVVEEEIENQDVVFDTIIAGDVMYKPFLPPLFFQTVIQHLSPNPTDDDNDNASAATLYLCHVPRAGITHSIIKNAAQDAGLYVVEEWDVDDVGERFVRGIVEADDVKRAKVYCMRRRRKDGIV